MFSLEFILFMIHSVVPLGLLVMAETIALLSGNLDLSIAAMAGFVAISSGVILAANRAIPGYVAVLLPIAIGILCGCLNGFLIGPLKFNPFLVTLGTLMIFDGGTFMISKSDVVATVLPDLYLFAGDPYVAIVTFLAILAFFAVLMKYTRFGLHLYYAGGGPVTASMMGINLGRTYFATFALSGLLTGLAALYYTGYIHTAAITLADGSLFPALAGAVIGGVSLSGGRGAVQNAFAGTVLLGVIEAGLSMFAISSEARIVSYGVMVIGAIVVNRVRDDVRDRLLRYAPR